MPGADMTGGIFGAVGSVVGAVIAGDAAKKATQMQSQAIDEAKGLVGSGLSPDTVQGIATRADTQHANQQLALLKQINPSLYQALQTGSAGVAAQAGGFGAGSESSAVANQAATEALQGDKTKEGQQQLIDAALTQLKAGATLPPDVEAQLVQAGLESSGMVTQSASGRGVGGQQLRTILGTAGIQLQQQRQQQAAGLLTQAQGLQTARQNILQSLFPRLTQNQLGQLQGSESAYGTAAGATPQAGLGGSQIANVWLSRVGALNQLGLQGAGVRAAGELAQGQIWGNAIGSAISGIGSMGGGSTPQVNYGSLGNLTAGSAGGGGNSALQQSLMPGAV
jgi:hypothetical protein